MRSVLSTGEVSVLSVSGEIVCYGLGSCIGVFLYDRFKKIGAGAHIMLPSNEKSSESDVMLSQIVNQMIDEGSHLLTIRARLVGGADILGINAYHIGIKNLGFVRTWLKKRGIIIIGEDVGGGESRTARLDIDTGQLHIKNSRNENYSI
ncbi:chemotaxis protein CheD [Fulvivirga sp.]|uniref:chemotaxis protein CheD n=1 Tax=Fulvivirga sp. TaxID=1931237 RepID=UPI0032F09A9C